MSRPVKCRKVCHFPTSTGFDPVEKSEAEVIQLTIDEYETIRLIDYEGLSQEQCCAYLQVARTTVQKIYESARAKLAHMIVEGRSLRIGGGDYALCDCRGKCLGLVPCGRREIFRNYTREKGEGVMRIMTTYRDGEIFPHFGRTEEVKVYDAEDGKVVSSEVIGTEGRAHGQLAEILEAMKPDVLICGGIGPGAVNALSSLNIKVCAFVEGSADAAVNAYLDGTLKYESSATCGEHEGHHHDCHCHH